MDRPAAARRSHHGWGHRRIHPDEILSSGKNGTAPANFVGQGELASEAGVSVCCSGEHASSYQNAQKQPQRHRVVSRMRVFIILLLFTESVRLSRAGAFLTSQGAEAIDAGMTATLFQLNS